MFIFYLIRRLRGDLDCAKDQIRMLEDQLNKHGIPLRSNIFNHVFCLSVGLFVSKTSKLQLKRSGPNLSGNCYDPRTNLSDLVWFGLIWFGTVWFALIWFGVVWFVLLWSGLAWFYLVWFGLVWVGMVWYGLVWFGMVWYGLVWFGMVRYGFFLVCFAFIWFGVV